MGGRREGRRRWQKLLAEQAGGGLGVAEFCRRRKLSPASFYQWRRKLGSSSPQTAAFVPLSVVGQSTASVRFPCGVVLRLPAGDERALAQVVSLLLAAGREPR